MHCREILSKLAAIDLKELKLIGRDHTCFAAGVIESKVRKQRRFEDKGDPRHTGAGTHGPAHQQFPEARRS